MTLPQGWADIRRWAAGPFGRRAPAFGVARAFSHDALYILLDEPTSNLTALNEAVILRSLKEEGG